MISASTLASPQPGKLAEVRGLDADHTTLRIASVVTYCVDRSLPADTGGGGEGRRRPLVAERSPILPGPFDGPPGDVRELCRSTP